jgi:hypothetical protein
VQQSPVPTNTAPQAKRLCSKGVIQTALLQAANWSKVDREPTQQLKLKEDKQSRLTSTLIARYTIFCLTSHEKSLIIVCANNSDNQVYIASMSNRAQLS